MYTKVNTPVKNIYNFRLNCIKYRADICFRALTLLAKYYDWHPAWERSCFSNVSRLARKTSL